MKQEKLFTTAFRLLRPFWLLVALATAIGIIGGLATAWLLASINSALQQNDDVSLDLIARLAGLCALSVAATAISGTANSVIGQKIIAELRKDISARILRAPIAALEAHRSYRLMSVLTGDVDTISAFTYNFSGYAIALAIIIGSFIYLLSLSPIIFLLSLAALALGAIVNALSQRRWVRNYQAVRASQDELHKQYRAITDGAKELKISLPRRGRVFGMLLSGAADRIADLKSQAMRVSWIADAAGSSIFFIIIGLMLAARKPLGIDSSVLSGAVIVLLYVRGPVAQIASALPVFDQARISFSRIAALSAELDQQEPNIPVTTDQPASTTLSAIRSITLTGITYTFAARGNTMPFTLGPLDLTVHAGEILFIVGANGSGKTTLIKLLLGLYAPQQGKLMLDDEEVTPEGRDGYRQLFSTIFSDYYLFDDLAYGALPQEAEPHLAQLGIGHKVMLKGDRFTTTDLSTGQRKRLALVQALLEHRPVVVTDEWASDQDPEFRRMFYEKLLPNMKRQGKTLIVISHDDRYFHVADRIIRMQDGRIVDRDPANSGAR
ncbi:cyclic peptide export ABC transporter [Rhizobium sp. YK2]|uniref:cyclic peptide export ABC transporter n=1 Tax=Rhizobium sp. YK2 TaxID=1860096 RepID=UPI00084C9469|nr:cyclic peptide export ABC transporter [Rhizobium sp. YK2]OEC94331.1 cyclic peptide transporter [Rhizobium sp. YK2]